jgi:hypothetical protein
MAFIATRIAGIVSGAVVTVGGFFELAELAARAKLRTTNMSTVRFMPDTGIGYCKQVLADVSLEPRFSEWQAKTAVPKWAKTNANFPRKQRKCFGRKVAQSLEWRRFLMG